MKGNELGNATCMGQVCVETVPENLERSESGAENKADKIR